MVCVSAQHQLLRRLPLRIPWGSHEFRGDIEPFDPVLVDSDVLQDIGSMDGGIPLPVFVPLGIIVKVQALIRSKRSRGEKA